VFAEEFASPEEFFRAWLVSYRRTHDRCAGLGFTPLLASFGVSMIERALIDSLCRAAQVSFATALRDNLLGIDAGEIHQDLAGLEPMNWLPARPALSIYVRHTVGLSDPLTAADIRADERLGDGLPQALEEYVEQCGLRYFKIKVCNQLDHDLDRLRRIATIVERSRGHDYQVTLDGNEQYSAAADFESLVESLRQDPTLATLWENTLVIEQPLERSVALDAQHTTGIRQLATSKPVIIDESDGTLGSFAEAVTLGYRGVSSKNCKGTIKSVLNAGLIWQLNDNGRRANYLMTGEDLATVGVVALQADLCLVAALGLEHVERNGHHYYRGLSHLTEPDRLAAIRAHPDLYHQQGDVVAPQLVDGRFQIASLQCTGFGFDVEPRMESMQGPEEWKFASLGLS